MFWGFKLLLRLFIIGIISCNDKIIPEVPDLPEMVGELALRKAVIGVKTNKFIYKMHGKLTGAQNSIIGYYNHDKKNAIYLSAFEDNEQAERALKKMSAKIMNTTAGFTPVNLDKRESIAIYRAKGMGLTHFFYRQDNFVIWWQVEPKKAEATLTHLIKFRFKVN